MTDSLPDNDTAIKSADAAQISAGAAQESVKAARQTALLSNRAYVAITNLLLGTLLPGKKIEINISWANTGNSSAEINGTMNLMLADSIQNP